MVAWVLEGQVRFQDELKGCYSLTVTTRTMVSLGYTAPKLAPATPTLSNRREASRQATLREREDKIAEKAEERRQAHLQAQALLASNAKVMEKQRVDGMCEKTRLGKKRKHDRDEWEEGYNI
jgi:hypothetical protein